MDHKGEPHIHPCTRCQIGTPCDSGTCQVVEAMGVLVGMPQKCSSCRSERLDPKFARVAVVLGSPVLEERGCVRPVDGALYYALVLSDAWRGARPLPIVAEERAKRPLAGLDPNHTEEWFPMEQLEAWLGDVFPASHVAIFAPEYLGQEYNLEARQHAEAWVKGGGLVKR